VFHPSVCIVGLEVTLMQVDQVFVGVDVSKATLMICRYGAAGAVKVNNQAVAIRAWLKALPIHALVAMESTGRYHALLARLVHRSGRKVFVLSAHDLHQYAKGVGARSKSDRVDARLIARYIAGHHAELHA
jgi:transposase